MSLPPRKKFKPVVDPRHYMEVAHCKKCGQGRILASYKMERAQIFKALLQIGWDVVPKIKCRACACPIADYWEMFNLQKAFNKNRPGVVNQEFLDLKRKAECKYSLKRLEKWFRSMQKDDAFIK